MEATVDYANFRAWVPRNVLPVGNVSPQDWVYYDWGPRAHAEPLVCLHPVVGSAESFHLQILRLSERGYRVIAPQLPPCWTAPAFCDGLHMFLDMLHVRRVHLYGCGLGGFLALHFAARRPDRVASLALTRAFLSTAAVDRKLVYSPSVLRWLPDFLVRNAVQSLFPKGRAELAVAEAAEFAIARTLAAPRDDLASRLALLVTRSSVVGRVRLPDRLVTLIDVATARQPDPDAASAFPNARRALLKSGGDFPYLAAPDDVALHLVVHLRRHAPPPVEPLPKPPPARPMTPADGRRKHRSSPVSSDHEGEARGAAEEQDDQSVSADDRALARLKEKAEEHVSSLESDRREVYASQVTMLRDAGIDIEDASLCAIVEDCGGSADLALEKIRGGYYADGFYEDLRQCALEEALQDLQCTEAEDGQAEGANSRKDPEEALTQTPDPRSRDSPSPARAIQSDGIASNPDGGGTLQGGVVSGPSPLALEPSRMSGHTRHFSSEQGTPSSSQDHRPGLQLHGVHMTKGPDTAARPERHPLTTSSGDEKSIGSADQASPRGFQSRTRPGRQMRSSRDRYPPETDSVSAYVTSERVGMRSEGKLIGRGPAPISNPGFALGQSRSPALGTAGGYGLSRSQSAERSSEKAAVADVWGRRLSTSMNMGGAVDGMFPSGSGPHESQNSDRGGHESSRGGLDVEGILGDDQSFDADVGDGWDEFRRSDLGSLARAGGSNERAPSADRSAVEQTPSADEEGDRLREWVMSAQSATASVRRKLDSD